MRNPGSRAALRAAHGGAGRIMENLTNFNLNKLRIKGLDREFGFAIITVVNPTALSVLPGRRFLFL